MAPPRLPGGKIPHNLLMGIVHLFCKYPDQQCYVHIFWDAENNQYIGYCPEQDPDDLTYAVECIRSDELEKQHELVVEIHSHPNMSAFFSVQDDHGGTHYHRFYAVIGVDILACKIKGNICVRYYSPPDKSYINVEPNDLFQLEGLSLER